MPACFTYYVCMNIRMYVCMYVCKCVRSNSRQMPACFTYYACMYIRMYVCIRMYEIFYFSNKFMLWKSKKSEKSLREDVPHPVDVETGKYVYVIPDYPWLPLDYSHPCFFSNPRTSILSSRWMSVVRPRSLHNVWWRLRSTGQPKYILVSSLLVQRWWGPSLGSWVV